MLRLIISFSIGLTLGVLAGIAVSELPGNTKADRAERRATELQSTIESLQRELVAQQRMVDALSKEIVAGAMREQQVAEGLNRLRANGELLESYLLQLQPYAEALDSEMRRSEHGK